MTVIKIDKNSKLGKGATATIYKAYYADELYAVKLYNENIRFNKAKIDAMLSNPPANLFIKFADDVFPQLAWPQKLVNFDDGVTNGYLMPVIDLDESFPLDYFYDSILFKKLNAPDESAISYKIEIARNLASIIADLHKHRHFFVDLKPQNIRVFRHTHIVTLLDCDGFSIASNSEARFPAELISSDYICPEAYKNQLSPKVLGEEQDLYALAVILFQLLNNGTHPFQGVLQDETINASTNDEKAALGLYPHGLEHDKRILPRCQSIHELWPTTTRKLFDRAFVGDHNNRPTALEWSEHFDQILKDKMLVRCEKFPLNISHMRFKLKECPRCYLDDIKINTNKSSSNSSNQGSTSPKIHDVQTDGYAWLKLIVLGGAVFFLINMCSQKPKDDSVGYSQKPNASVSRPKSETNSVEPINNETILNESHPKPIKNDIDSIQKSIDIGISQKKDFEVEFKKWSEKNPWFQTELEMKVFALHVVDELNKKGLKDPKTYFTQLDKTVHENFKFYFENLEKNKLKTAEIQYEKGWKFLVGKGVKKDLSEAFKWFSLAAESGNMEAQSVLALMYEKGNGVDADKSKAIYWYGVAAKQGESDAIKWLKKHNESENGLKNSSNLNRKSADHGDVIAQRNMAESFYTGNGVTKNLKTAYDWFLIAALNGDAISQRSIGVMYEKGYGIKKNYKEAMSWYIKSAQQNNIDAKFNLGLMYQEGLGVSKDLKEAFNWYLSAAKQGHINAQYFIGNMYEKGLGVNKDLKESFVWFKKCAEQGDATAQFEIGYMYFNGQGVEKDYMDAAFWYRKSAEQGNALAQQELGYMYANGLVGAPEDRNKWHRDFGNLDVMGH